VRKAIRIVLPALGFLALLGATLFVALRWEEIPAQVPANFDFAGRIESWTGKQELWIELGFGWLFTVFMALGIRFPNLGGMRVSALRAGRLRVKAPAELLAVMALVIGLLFSYLAVCTALCRNLGVWCLPVALLAVLLPLVVTLLFARH
jgi:hypothetical protein